MGSSRWIGVAGVGTGLWLCLVPSAWAADGKVVEAAETSGAPALSKEMAEQIRSAIEAENDPEMKAAMQEQLGLLESGQADLRSDKELSVGAPRAETAGTLTGGQLADAVRAVGFPGPPVENSSLGPPVQIDLEGEGGGGDHLPPEARKELEDLFKQGTGDPTSEKDRELREKAQDILERYGVDPREMETGREQEWGERGDWKEHGGLETRGGGFERAFEQMAPEAREQMERFSTGEREAFMREHEMPSYERDAASRAHERDTAPREHEAMTREVEAPAREYEAPTREHEAPMREYEAPMREYEAPVREYEAPSQERETVTREYEAPSREYEAVSREYEAPMREHQAPEPVREAPEPMAHEYQPPQPPQ